MRILIVDDNPDDRQLAIRALRQAFAASPSLDILEAADPEGVQAALEADLLDLVVTDYALRWSTGLDVLDQVRVRNPDTPVILFTNTGNEEVAAEALRKGASDYVIKRHNQYRRLGTAAVSAIERAALQTRVRTLHEHERAARVEAEEASRLREEFLATLSHELRTPLHTILGWVNLLKIGAVPRDDERRRAYDVIERSARTQVRLIEDLLDLSRLASGQFRLRFEIVPISKVIDEAVTSVRLMAEEKSIELAQDTASEDSPVRADPARLQQVIWNLLTNAIKFSEPGGQVTIGTRALPSGVEVCVADAGAGIDAAFLPHVFDRFRQADASTTRRSGGMGIGLAIVKSLIEAHGGSIRAESAGLGKGARFCFRLPLPASRDASVHDSTASATTPVSISGITVLVVDDNAESLAVMRRTLEHAGARAVLASSAREAYSAASKAMPDIVVTDIGMPEEDGYSLARRLRDLPSGRQTPIVALTAYARGEDRQRAADAGFVGHLGKPVEPGELIACIAKLARRSKKER